jgi:DNA-binding PadR family transcriptional regulator
MFNSIELRRVLLKLIADEPRHGYDLIRAIEELTHGEYSPSPGVVYPALSLLEDLGRIEVQPGEGSRKKYAVTQEGLTYLERCAENIEELFERLEQSGEGRRRSARPELGRAVGNLMTALRNRAASEGWNEDLLNDVVDIIDEAAKRIERAR